MDLSDKLEYIKKRLKENKPSYLAYLFTFMHFFLSFFWQRNIFKFSTDWTEWKGQGFWLTDVRQSYVNEGTESVMVFILSRIVELVFIYLLWKIVFLFKKISKKTLWIFGVIFFVYLAIGFFNYPQTFASMEIDNFGNYSRAIRFLPTYWQSVYTGVFYAGSMMAIPSAFGIFFFQCLMFVSAIGYVFEKTEIYFPKRKAKYLLLFLFLLPESYFLAFNAYRNNIYTSLCIFYFARLAFGYLKYRRGEQEKLNLFSEIGFILLTCIVIIWRSEGIILGACGIVFYIVIYKGRKLKRNLLIFASFICVLYCMHWCQNVGSVKYYGKDYSIINTTDVLYNIFNDSNVALDYPGVDKDLGAIEKVIPVQLLREAGTGAYRNYNWTLGHKDFNQTLVSDEVADAYMSAYYRIIFHNPADYLNVKFNYFFQSIGVNASHKTNTYKGTVTPLENFQYNATITDPAEVYQGKFTNYWFNNRHRTLIYSVITSIITTWNNLWLNTGVKVIANVFVIFIDIYILIKCFIDIFENDVRKGLKKHGAFFLIFFTIIGEIVGIVLFMPEGRPQYLYPMLFSSYIMIYLYFTVSKHMQNLKEENKNE